MFAHCQLIEQEVILLDEGEDRSSLVDVVKNFPAHNPCLPLILLYFPSHDVEEGALATAIAPEQPEDLVLVYGYVDLG